MVEDKILQVINKIKNYIEITDFEQAIEIENKFVETVQENFQSFLRNKLGINNENILNYAVNNFEQMKYEIEEILKSRKNNNIDSKLTIVKEELSKEEIDGTKKENIINEKMNEKKTDYYESIQQILNNAVNNSINQLSRELDYQKINNEKIDEILENIKEFFNEYSWKIIEEFNIKLTDLDNEIKKYVEIIVDEVMKEEENEKLKTEEEKFKESLEVPNENNEIETKATDKLEKENLLDASEIFDNNKETNKKYTNEDLDDKDIF